MRFNAAIESDSGGLVATCDELGVSGYGLSPVGALDALRAEIRYRVELCPCSSVGDEYVELVVSK